MELCERYLHYMSALCEGTMPAPPELALTANTTEERAAQLQSALKDLSVPDFVRLCAKSTGDELDEAIFDHFSEEDFSRALLQMLNAAAEPEEVEEKPPAAESTPDPDAGKHAFEVFCDCVELDEQLVAYLIDILKCGDKAAFYKLSQVTTQLDLDPREFLYWLDIARTTAQTMSAPARPSWTRASRASMKKSRASFWGHCSQAIRRRSNSSAPKRPSCGTCLPRPMNGTVKTIWTATIRCGLF